jgi:hypothetical protein
MLCTVYMHLMFRSVKKTQVGLGLGLSSIFYCIKRLAFFEQLTDIIAIYTVLQKTKAMFFTV